VTGISRSGLFEWRYTFTPPLCLNGIYGTNIPFSVLVVGHVVRRYILRIKIDFFPPNSKAAFFVLEERCVFSGTVNSTAKRSHITL